MGIRNFGGVSGVHSGLTGLGADDHTIYALLAGRAGGQVFIGGTASGENLTLQSTSHGTKGKILFGTSAYDEVNNRLGVKTDTPDAEFHVVGRAHITGRIDCDDVVRLFGGTVGSPGVHNRTDADTGLFLEGLNILSLVTGGVRGLIIDASQNVGLNTLTPNSRLQVAGSVAFPPILKVTTYTLDDTDFHVQGDTTSGAFTLTLPAVAGVVGRVFHLSKVDATANSLTAKGNGAETIDGVNTAVLSSQFNSLMLHAVNNAFTDWKIL